MAQKPPVPFASQRISASPFQFNENTNQWTPIILNDPSAQFSYLNLQSINPATITAQKFPEPKPALLSKVCMISYNVWFDAFYKEVRGEALLRLIQDHKADVVCLQEVTPQFVDWVLKDAHMRSNYNMSCHSSTVAQVTSYGVMMLISKSIPIVNMYVQTMPTRMGRSVLLAEVQLASGVFCFSTAHLESMGNAPLRMQQLAIISEKLAPFSQSLICGDFNFTDYSKENDYMTKVFPTGIDVWKQMHPSQKGFTYDTTVCTMINHYDQSRYDRIVLKGSDVWVPKSISIIGDKPIRMFNDPGLVVFPSDHFGLLFQMEYNGVVGAPNSVKVETDQYFVQSMCNQFFLDADFNTNAQHPPLIVFKHHGGANQKWIFDKSSDTIKCAMGDLFLDVSHDGAVICSAEKPSNSSQKWTVKSGQIVHVATGKVLDVDYASKESGTKVILYKPTGQSNQQWKFIKT